MAYSDFTLQDLHRKFGISNKIVSLFENIEPLELSPTLKESLALARTLPVRSEKAKSELIVMPVLLDLLKRNNAFFTIYSGDTLTADKANGLTGECDFIIAKNTGSFDINTPILTIVEAKKNDVNIGIPQCAAQMVGAKVYNKVYGNEVNTIYGCVTTADDWQFLKFEDKLISIDNRKYYLGDVQKIIGILQHITEQFKKELADY